jgi:hypothetical protein
MTAIGLGMLMLAARSVTFPVGAADLSASVLPGTIAFMAGSFIGGLLAAALWDLRSCPFAWNTPGLATRAARELRIGGALVFGVAGGLGLAVHAGLGGPVWLPAIAACLGYSVGLFNMDPAASRAWGLPGVLAAGLPVFFMHEIASVTSATGWSGVAVVAAIMFGVIELNGAGRAWRNRSRLDPREDGHAAGSLPGVRAGGSAATRAAPREGADTFTGVRRSDADWIRALLHEAYAQTRGGLLGAALRLAIAMLVFAVILQVYLGAVAGLREKAAVTADGTPSGLAWTIERVSGLVSAMSLDRFASPIQGAGLVPTTLCVAVMMSIFVTGMPNLPALGVIRPLSRRRLGRLVWLRTQAEDAALLLAALLVFLIATALLDTLATGDPWPNYWRWVLTLASVFTLMPAARWIRLMMLDAKVRRTTAEVFDRQGLVAHSCIVSALIAGSIPLISCGTARGGPPARAAYSW